MIAPQTAYPLTSWASLKLTKMLGYLLNAMLLSKIRLSSSIDSV